MLGKNTLGACSYSACRELHNKGLRPLRNGIWKDCLAGTWRPNPQQLVFATRNELPGMRICS
jgi:hypothetical protein